MRMSSRPLQRLQEWTDASALRDKLQTEENNPDPSKSKRKSSVVATSPIGNRKAGSPARSPSAWTTKAATQTLPMDVQPEI